MRDWTRVRERYMRDELPVRLGGLSANLARLSSAAEMSLNQDFASGLLDESKWFIEWTATEAELSTASQLVNLQLQLAQWRRSVDKIWADAAVRKEIGNQAKEWSDRVLALSGMLGD